MVIRVVITSYSIHYTKLYDDDILGIIALTVVTSLADKTVNIALVIIKILLFFLFAGVVGIIFHKLFTIWVSKANKDLRRFVIVAFAFCLLLSFVAEDFFGVADITGSFIAGLIISNTERTKYIASRFETISYMLLSPMFFASIGIQVEIGKMDSSIILFSVIIVIAAILTKVIGCGLGAKISKFSNRESLRVGTGMVSRGEVALIVANKGAAVGLMTAAFFAPIVIMVVITTVITPILLKLAYNSKNDDEQKYIKSDLVENYSELEKVV